MERSLFDRTEDDDSGAQAPRIDPGAPLAERMRPRTLDEVLGQDHLIGPGRVLRRAVEEDSLRPLIFWGPPGTGKTTLARIIAGKTKRALHHAERGAPRREGVARRRGRGEAHAAEKGADDSVHRRDPPLQQGPAGRPPAPRGKRHAHAHRRHDGKSLFRGHTAPALPRARVRARGIERRAHRSASPPRPWRMPSVGSAF